jgi:hypothetical protein
MGVEPLQLCRNFCEREPLSIDLGRAHKPLHEVFNIRAAHHPLPSTCSIACMAGSL